MPLHKFYQRRYVVNIAIPQYGYNAEMARYENFRLIGATLK